MKASVCSGRATVALLSALACTTASWTPALAIGPAVTATHAQVYVLGRQIPFAHLGITYGDPVAQVDDPGLHSMLAAVGARSSWQPGTRFVAITRGDGKLITFTLGSDAVSVDGVAESMPFAPFASGSELYLPLLPLARALDLGVRGFRGGYVFVPQIESVTPRREGSATIVRIAGSAPLTWHSSYANSARAHVLTVSFPGFGTDAAGSQPIAAGLATGASVSESGPPGYPTTAVAIALKHAATFAAHRVGAGAAVDVVIARDSAQLRAATPISTPPSVHVAVTPLQTMAPAPKPTPPPTLPPPTPESTLEPTQTTSPEVVPSGVATAEPLGAGGSPSPSSSEPSGSPSPGASQPPLTTQKITNVSVAEVQNGTRITLTLTGPVAFEWHRLGDPDDRYWLDISHAVLVGPAQTLTSKLAFIKEIKVSQHLLDPDQVVRVSITPTQAIDVRVGTIAGSPNQLGVEIENQPPSPDAPIAGIGNTIVTAQASPPPSPTQPVLPARTDPTLIVIDPGHGGSDPGSLNPGYGLTESHVTLNIAERLEADLKRQGWHVVMTRDGDYDVGPPFGTASEELQARCDVANAAGARLFVSVHVNSSVSAAPNGGTTYYWHPGDRALAQTVQNDLITASGITDDGVIRNNFYVIHHTRMPSILVEVAYLSNPHDATLLSRQSFLDQIAAGIARGIADFTGGPPSSVGQAKPQQPPGAPKP